MRKIKVLIVDDSALVRQVLSAQLQKTVDIEVVATATDPLFAMEKMCLNWPDVIVLDVEMPRMDGITFLKKVMSTRPTPIVICSTLTTQGADVSIKAMAEGAVAIITKPQVGLKQFFQDDAEDLVSVVRGAARANMSRFMVNAKKMHIVTRASTIKSSAAPDKQSAPLTINGSTKLNADHILSQASETVLETTDKLIAIGTSTGGTQALELVLSTLPRTISGIVIVQHMPEKFTASFAKRLNDICQIDVHEAKNGDRVLAGCAMIAPGGKHMLIRRSGAQYHVEIIDGPPVNRHKPSVDVLFRSVAKCAGRNAMGIIMTGMGDDGAKGLKEMHDMQALTIAQDEKSSVVYGMPKEAVKLGGVDYSVGLNQIAQRIMTYCRI